MNNIRVNFAASLFVILLSATLFTAAAQTEKRIEEIRKIYKEANEKIVEANQNGEYSTVFLTEIVVNKNRGSYPAVGIFQSTIRFYYTFGDREKNPYPNRLLKIEIETKRSSVIEKYEYLFNEKEKLIFYYESENADENKLERRIYLQNEGAIKIIEGEKDLAVEKSRISLKELLLEKAKLVKLFQNTLDY